MNSNNTSAFVAEAAALLKEHARKELVSVLDSVRGKKGLVIDPSLSGPLSLIAEYSLLKEHGVDKIFHLGPDRPETDLKSLIYICRPQITLAKHIAAHIRQQANYVSRIEFSLFFVPRRTLVCERVLEEEGVYADVTISEFRMDLVSLEEDVLSMEFDNCFKEIFVDGDTSSLYYVAKAVMKLQSVFGVIPTILGKGTYAKILSDTIIRMKRELLANAGDSPAMIDQIFPTRSEIDSMIILDRTVDLMGPMCTQLTYEGLLDEIYKIKSTFVEVDASMVATATAGPNAPKTKKVTLNNRDRLYSQLRDLNFAVVGSVLNQNARRIQNEIEGRHQAQTMSQIKDFIGKLGGIETEKVSLKLHTSLAEQINEYTLDQDFIRSLEVQQNVLAGTLLNPHIEFIEELMNKQAPLMQVLRLLSIYSMANGGLKTKQYEYFKREILQTYGIEQLQTMQHMSKLGLFKSSEIAPTRNNFPQLRKMLRLVVDNIDDRNPNDISYVYSGFAPLSVRLVQAACQRVQGSSAPSTVASAPVPTPSASAAVSAIEPSSSPPAPSSAAAAGGGRAPNSPQLRRAATLIGGLAGTLLGGAESSNLFGGSASGSMAGSVSWKGIEETLKLVQGGPVFEETQETPDEGLAAKRSNGSNNSPKVTIVLYLGGCSYAEISSLRFMSRREEGRQFVVVTTNVINGTSLLESLQQQLNVTSIVD